MGFNKITASLSIFITMLLSGQLFAQDTLHAANVEAILYMGQGSRQPLIVGLGGSEGGNAWASQHWKKTRDQFIAKGYAFLAIGYFGCNNTPKILDRVAIDEVYAAIAEASKNKSIDKGKIAVLGGSRGADLALLLGSYYKDISCIIGMSSSHAVFPGHTQDFNSSCWTYQGKELPFIPVNEAAVPFLINHDLRRAFEAMITDSVAEQKALIKVERINGPVLLLSATQDEIIPAVTMGNKMIARLQANHFKHFYEQVIYEGGHAAPTKDFDKIFAFIKTHFPSNL